MLRYTLTKKEKKLAIITAVLALIAVVFNLAIAPFWKNYRELNRQINSKVLTSKQSQRLLDAYSRLEKEYAVYSRYFEPLKPKLAVNQVLQEIKQVSEASSCRIVSIKPFDLRNAVSYQEIVVDIALEATVGDFSRFLHQIENLANPLRVKNFTLSPKSNTAGEIKANLRAKKIVFLP